MFWRGLTQPRSSRTETLNGAALSKNSDAYVENPRQLLSQGQCKVEAIRAIFPFLVTTASKKSSVTCLSCYSFSKIRTFAIPGQWSIGSGQLASCLSSHFQDVANNSTVHLRCVILCFALVSSLRSKESCNKITTVRHRLHWFGSWLEKIILLEQCLCVARSTDVLEI